MEAAATRSVIFTPTAADTLAAHRSYFRLARVRRKMASAFAGIFVLAVLIFDPALAMFDAKAPLTDLAVAALAAGAFVGAIMLLNRLGQKSRIARLYAGTKRLRLEYSVTWDDEAIAIATVQHSERHLWNDFVAWSASATTLMLFQTETMYNFIPASAFAPGGLDDIARILKACGIPRR